MIAIIASDEILKPGRPQSPGFFFSEPDRPGPNGASSGEWSGDGSFCGTFSMAEEQFDVVDDDDRVLEQRARSEVHRLKLLHRATHVFVFRSDQTMLIHKRSPSKEEFPSVWTSSCSGHVSAGESYDESAPRELLEELGFQAPLSFLKKFAACPDTSYEFTVLYRTLFDGPISPDPDEMTEVKWMKPSEITAWIQSSPDDFSPAFRLLFLSVKDQL